MKKREVTQMQEIVENNHNALTIFSDLTMPQAVVVSFGMIAVSIGLSVALSYGWAPDFDFKNRHFRFVRQVEQILT